MIWRLLVLAGLMCTCLTAEECTPGPGGPIRVGVIGFEENAIERLKMYNLAFDQLSVRLIRTSVLPSLRRTFAVRAGTYLEVLDWYRKCQIDVGIVTAGVGAQILADGADPSAFALQELRHGESTYHSKLVGDRDAELPTAEQIIRDLNRSDHGGRQILAINPASASGFIVPAAFLREVDPKFTMPSAAIEWLQEHDEPGQRIAEEGRSLSIGFVSSDTNISQNGPVKPGCLKSTTLNKSLCDYPIPRGAVIINHRLPVPEFNVLRRLLVASLPSAVETSRKSFPHSDYSVVPAKSNLVEQLRPMKEFLASAPKEYKQELSAPKLSMVDILNDLHAYHELYGKPALLAFVLSGGGAKCAYQAGALASAMEAIRTQREKASKRVNDACRDLDVGAVIGTSGGGLNALLFADQVSAEVSPQTSVKDENGRTEKMLYNSWAKSSLVSVAQPRRMIALGAGWLLGSGSLYIALFFGLAWSRVRYIAKGHRVDTLTTQRLVTCVVFLIGIVWLLVMRYAPLERQPSLLQFAHAFGRDQDFRWAASVSIVSFVVLFLRRQLLLPREVTDRVTNYDFLRMMAAGTLSIAASVFLAGTLVSGSSILDSRAVALRVRDAYVQASGKIPGTAAANTLLGQPFVRNRLKRDLIITTSVIHSDDRDQGQELYFFSSMRDLRQVDPRFCDLENLETVDALRVAAASSTIWPVFDTAKVTLPKNTGTCTGKVMSLADGGFVHNNPIEAAVLWGATHIVVINASPVANSVGESMPDALNYLFDQAQRVDQLVRGRVRVYEIRPACATCPEDRSYLAAQQARDERLSLFPDTFTFVSDYLYAAFERGKLDAAANRFRRIPAEPTW